MQNNIKRVYGLHERIKDLDKTLEHVYPIAVLDGDIFYIFDSKANRYEFVMEHPTPFPLPEGIMAAFPLDFYDNKIAAIICAKELENPDNDVFVYHEFIHCYQWNSCEPRIKQELTIAEQQADNPMWEIDHPFPYEDDIFVSLTTELKNAKQLEPFTKYHKKLKEYLNETDFEYMVWQEWKEGYARYVENLIREKLAMKKNINDLSAPFGRVHFYEIGSRYIELLIKSDSTLNTDLEKLFYTMSGES